MNDIQTILIETDEQTQMALRVALRSPKARFQRLQIAIEVASQATNEQAESCWNRSRLSFSKCLFPVLLAMDVPICVICCFVR
ncbi:hypothetical protein QUB56_19200 [Microcoleus sp. AR_TQ3_B6]|uniref:hypothetical protein n=1 Tax=Microcoleus sp. AR_TQ3_B6 TaxID=3055284 RepID=UPI002FD529BC